MRDTDVSGIRDTEDRSLDFVIYLGEANASPVVCMYLTIKLISSYIKQINIYELFVSKMGCQIFRKIMILSETVIYMN